MIHIVISILTILSGALIITNGITIVRRISGGYCVKPSRNSIFGMSCIGNIITLWGVVGITYGNIVLVSPFFAISHDAMLLLDSFVLCFSMCLAAYSLVLRYTVYKITPIVNATKLNKKEDNSFNDSFA